MEWTSWEHSGLTPIFGQIHQDLEPLEGKSILVLCCATGFFPSTFSSRMDTGRVVGLELDDESLAAARKWVGPGRRTCPVSLLKAEPRRIPFPDESFDALLSDFILYPTPRPTEIGQAEMARVLKPGGRMVLTDVIVTRIMPQEIRDELKTIGLGYLCDATVDDFHRWMSRAGLSNVEVTDMTRYARKAWSRRQAADPAHAHAYSILLEDPKWRLGEAIYYIYARADKPAVK